MQCQLLFFEKKNDWSNIDKHLKNILEPYQIVTDNYSLNEFLQQCGKNSRTLRDIFPEEGDITYEVYKASKKIQQQYKKYFQNVAFDGIEIFDGIENQLLDQIILLEKTRKILEEKKNTIFIFEGFSFTYYAIKKLANEMKYDSDLVINILRKNGIKRLKPTKNYNMFNLKNILYLVESPYFTQLKKTVVLKIILFAILRVIPKIRSMPKDFRGIFHEYLIELILKHVIDEKIAINSAYNLDCIFFLTTNKEDLYLKSIYPIFDKFKQENIDYQTFVIDLITHGVLSKMKVPFVNLFLEINSLSHLIRSTREGKRIRKEVEYVAENNNLSLLHNGQISGFIINEIYRSAAIMRICGHIFERMKLKSIVIATDGVMYGNSVTSVSRKQNIPSFFVPSTIINSNPLHSNWYHADKICLYGLQGVDALTELGYDKNRLILTGNPKYDKFKKLDYKKSRKILEEYHIDEKKKLVVVGMARWHDGDEVWMSELVKFCNKNDFEIVIKIHPMYKEMLNEESEKKILTISKNCQNMRFFIIYDIDLHILLAAADLVITDYSNVGAEAILLDKSLVTVNFVKESFEKDQRYHEYGAAIYTEEYQELEKFILEIFIENKHIKELEVGRKIAADKYNYHNDGKAAERIFELLTDKKEKSTVIIR